MKHFLLSLKCLLVGTFCFGQVHVNGYFRSNGTYVQPHERTYPNATKTDNYSYPGNYNPNTGNFTGGSNYGYTNNSGYSVYYQPLSHQDCVNALYYFKYQILKNRGAYNLFNIYGQPIGACSAIIGNSRTVTFLDGTPACVVTYPESNTKTYEVTMGNSTRTRHRPFIGLWVLGCAAVATLFIVVAAGS
jgi:hypothetical protein